MTADAHGAFVVGSMSLGGGMFSHLSWVKRGINLHGSPQGRCDIPPSNQFEVLVAVVIVILGYKKTCGKTAAQGKAHNINAIGVGHAIDFSAPYFKRGNVVVVRFPSEDGKSIIPLARYNEVATPVGPII